MTEPPVLTPPSSDFVVIHVGALSAALEKLQAGITAAQLLETVNQEEHIPPPPGVCSCSERKWAMPQPSTQPPEKGSDVPPIDKSTFAWRPVPSDEVKARRLKLRDLAYSQFPNGPYR